MAAIDHANHMISAAAIAGTMAGILPPLAALVAIIWYAIQIWESRTVQEWFKRHHPHARRLEKLKASERRENKDPPDLPAHR